MTRSKIHVAPYHEINGMRTFTDSFIMLLYNRIHDEGHDHVFKDGTIRDDLEFLDVMKHSNTLLYVLSVDTGSATGPELAGIVWLNRFENRTARMHWCTFRGTSIQDKIEMGRCTLDHLIHTGDIDNGGYLFDALIGYLPEKNKAALEFVKACGGHVGGRVPNLIWDAVNERSEPGIIIYYVRGDSDD